MEMLFQQGRVLWAWQCANKNARCLINILNFQNFLQNYLEKMQ